jgi:transcription elongation factor Elf1
MAPNLLSNTFNKDGLAFIMENLSLKEIKTDTFVEEKQSFFKRIFGCWHSRMSKPVTIDKTTFCYCKDCGLRRRYDFTTFKTQGAFYSARPNKTLYFV